MSNHTIFVFPGTISAPLAEVGGKGLSLMQGSQAGLPVPQALFYLSRFSSLGFKNCKLPKHGANLSSQTNMIWKHHVMLFNNTHSHFH